MRTVICFFAFCLAIALFASCEIPDMTWQALIPNTLAGWSDDPATSFSPSACVKDTQGLIHLRGRMADSTASATASPAFVIPDGYRPAKNKFLSIAAYTSTGYSLITLQIYPSGNVNLDSGTAATISYIYLDGVVFDPN